MKKMIVLALMAGIAAVPLSASKVKGSTVLKDCQPTAQTPDKEHKHQAFDLSFPAEGKNYTCRTDTDHSMNPTDFVVGETMSYEINGKKVKISTPANKHVDCKVVRVEKAAAM